MHVAGKLAVELSVQHGLLSLPIASWLVPARLRTIGQELDGKQLTVTPHGRGRVQRASLLHAWSDGVHFPPLSAESVLGVAHLSKVDLTFPVATLY